MTTLPIGLYDRLISEDELDDIKQLISNNQTINQARQSAWIITLAPRVVVIPITKMLKSAMLILVFVETKAKHNNFIKNSDE